MTVTTKFNEHRLGWEFWVSMEIMLKNAYLQTVY